MNSVLAIVREDTLFIYEQKDGKYNEIAHVKVTKAWDDSAIMNIITAIAQIENNGHKPKKDPIENILKTVDETQGKKASRKKHPTAKKKPSVRQLTEERLLKALGGFTQEWRTMRDAHEAIDKYMPWSGFQQDVKKTFELGYLDQRNETPDEQKARGGQGRVCIMYKLNAAGINRLALLKKEAQKN